MKTTTIILAALMVLQINSLFANNDGVPVNTSKVMNLSTVLLLTPATPIEATFEDMAPVAEILVLAPVTPKEATFEDEAEDLTITRLAPVTPEEADFKDEAPALHSSLAPVTPLEADFDELP